MRIASTCAGVAFSPRRTRTGSVGITLEITKTMTTSPASVGTNQASREIIISRRRIERPSSKARWQSPVAKPGGACRRQAPPISNRRYRLLVVGPAHILPATDRTEADSADVGGVGAVPLRVVDED